MSDLIDVHHSAQRALRAHGLAEFRQMLLAKSALSGAASNTTAQN